MNCEFMEMVKVEGLENMSNNSIIENIDTVNEILSNSGYNVIFMEEELDELFSGMTFTDCIDIVNNSEVYGHKNDKFSNRYEWYTMHDNGNIIAIPDYYMRDFLTDIGLEDLIDNTL